MEKSTQDQRSDSAKSNKKNQVNGNSSSYSEGSYNAKTKKYAEEIGDKLRDYTYDQRYKWIMDKKDEGCK